MSLELCRDFELVLLTHFPESEIGCLVTYSSWASGVLLWCFGSWPLGSLSVIGVAT